MTFFPEEKMSKDSPFPRLDADYCRPPQRRLRTIRGAQSDLLIFQMKPIHRYSTV